MAITQPMGQAHQIPVDCSAVRESRIASITRRIRSVKVAVINCRIMPAPRSTPSVASLAETTK